MERNNKFFNPLIVCFVTALVLGGTLIGTIFSMNNQEAQEIMKETVFFSGNFNEAFSNAFFKKLFWIIVFATGGINIFLVPLALSGVVIKSYSYGFTSGCIVSSMGTYGYFTVLSGLFLQNFLFAVVSVLYTSYGINKSFECFLNRRNYECVSGKNKNFMLVSIIVLFTTLIISAVEGGISVFLYDV